MQKSNKAFTLVELIVVITILAILGTIAFINLQGYSTSARDGKRVSDINNIMKKIGIESSKGTSLSTLITTTKTNSGLTIDGNSGSSIQGTANFATLKEDGSKFKDPITNGDYVFSYSVGGTGTGAYKFTQVSTVNEEENTAVVKGNYYQMQPSDSPSITYNPDNTYFVVDGGIDLPYEIVEGTTPTPPVVTNSCDTQPNYTNASFTAGTPTSENQLRQDTNNANPCYYECTNGYTGSTCSTPPLVGWRALDPNCDIEDITIGTQVWAGCNSTLGTGFEWGKKDDGTDGIIGSCFPNYDGTINLANCDSLNPLLTSSAKANTWFTGTNVNGDSEYNTIWGKLYTWDSLDTDGNYIVDVNDTNKVCGVGYHIPTDGEFTTLENYIILNNSNNNQIGWNLHINKTNLNNISNALKLPLTGFRTTDRTSFYKRGMDAYLWTNTISTPPYVSYRFLSYDSGGFNINSTTKNNGFSVRCIKD
ncbi:MAG: FISUMP domain-containing protein [Candidatus Gracilibacteria bacterium]|nr:FISUMP domain-containing protein [Candidatus Gracilibacteria bacterium]